MIDAAGNPIVAAPGTIEISSVNGALLDASGRVTTNLRIGCSDDGIGVGDISLSGFLNFAVLTADREALTH